MTSLQQSAPGSKSSKFVNVNPLDPFIKPFETHDTDEHSALAESLNRRLENHVIENRRTSSAPQRLQHSHGGGIDPLASVAATDNALLPSSSSKATTHLRPAALPSHQEDSESGESELDEDDDLVIAAIREARMHELREAQRQRASEESKGHGDYRTISQDEFLPECLETSSAYVAVHFCHGQFERCKIMDHHLAAVAKRHTTCKFLRIDAEKAPFFVQKLQVRILPTVLVFKEGQVADRLVGFEGLASATKDPDQWKTSQLQRWLSSTGAIVYDPDDSESDDDNTMENVVNRVNRIQVQHESSLYSSRRIQDDDDW